MSGDLPQSSKTETAGAAAARQTVLELARLLARIAAREDDAAERKSRQGIDAAGTRELAAAPAQGQSHSTG